MPAYRHPRHDDPDTGPPPRMIHVSRAERAPVDDEGVFTVPVGVARAEAERHGVSLDSMRLDGGTCEVVKADGEVCGRDLPCPYHGEDDE